MRNVAGRGSSVLVRTHRARRTLSGVCVDDSCLDTRMPTRNALMRTEASTVAGHQQTRSHGERCPSRVRTVRAHRLSDYPAAVDESLCGSIDSSGRTVVGADLAPFRGHAEMLVSLRAHQTQCPMV